MSLDTVSVVPDVALSARFDPSHPVAETRGTGPWGEKMTALSRYNPIATLDPVVPPRPEGFGRLTRTSRSDHRAVCRP